MAKTNFLLYFVGIFSLASSIVAQPTLVEGTAATSPEPQTAAWAVEWWMPRHEQKLEEKKAMQQVDLLMIGDSITHGWEQTGKDTWDKYYGHRLALNLGFGGDRTEQVLWRLDHGEMDDIHPKVAVIMIGTNNAGHRQDPPDAVFQGIEAIVQRIRTSLPETKILLLAIFPRGAGPEDPLRQLNEKVNERLPELADQKHVFFLDINHVFLDEQGMLPESIMPDLLHPNARGYELWAEAMEPELVRLLK